MYIRYSDIIINVESLINNAASSKSIFLLHGFTGSSHDWDEIAPGINKNFNIYCIDLIGHGKSDSPDDVFLYSQTSISEQVKEVVLTVNSSDNFICGYSMGGRASLSFAVRNNSLLKGIILESSTPGIEAAKLREKRISQDETLAEFIEEKSIDEFVEYWMNLEIFSSQKNLSAEKLRAIAEKKKLNNKTGLANSLRGFGTGTMQPMFEDLKFLNLPSLLITGKLDHKFTEINRKTSSLFPNAVHKIIQGTGHNTHLEKPQEFLSLLNTFLKQF